MYTKNGHMSRTFTYDSEERLQGRAGSGVIFKKWMDGRLDEWMIGVGGGVRLLGVPPAAG